jgi:hypothetical protein
MIRHKAKALDARSRATFTKAAQGLPSIPAEILRPLSLVELEGRSYHKQMLSRTERLELPSVDATRVSALLSVASSPYLVESRASLEHPLASLMNAKTLDEVRMAQEVLTDTVRSGHRKVFEKGLILACKNALHQVGFHSVETGKGPFVGSRVIGTDAAGRALVVEIRPRENGDPRLAAEVVGIRDGSCHQILDAFEIALSKQGVQYTRPQRKSTGGVCELDAAKDFLRRLVRPAGISAQVVTPGNVDAQRRRTQRLNQKKEVTHR